MTERNYQQNTLITGFVHNAEGAYLMLWTGQWRRMIDDENVKGET